MQDIVISTEIVKYFVKSIAINDNGNNWFSLCLKPSGTKIYNINMEEKRDVRGLIVLANVLLFNSAL